MAPKIQHLQLPPQPNHCSCPPRTFLPALCRIFLDECAPENVLEVAARAVTYYLDVSAECTRRIVAVDGTIKAICNRLIVADVSSRASKDLAEQCIKVSNRLLVKCVFLKHRPTFVYFSQPIWFYVCNSFQLFLGAGTHLHA